MLGEIKPVAQEKHGPGYRRWFGDEEMDLIVWYAKDGGIEGFMLCYDKTGKEHAFTWRKTGHFSHASVDQGESAPAANRTPILAPDGNVPLQRVLREFKRSSKELEAGLAKFVTEKLNSFGKPKRAK